MDNLDGSGLNQTAIVYATLTKAILDGDLGPGAKLNEPSIAGDLQVSRAPVREAIRRLQERGMVTYVPNFGSRVVAPTLAEFLALLDVREALEGMACQLAAEAMPDDAMKALDRLVEADGDTLKRDPEGPLEQQENEGDFHLLIAQGCGNPVLADLLCDHFYPRLKLCRARHRTIRGRGLAAWTEHRRIMDALLNRDGEMAQLLMRRHIRSARDALTATADAA